MIYSDRMTLLGVSPLANLLFHMWSLSDRIVSLSIARRVGILSWLICIYMFINLILPSITCTESNTCRKRKSSFLLSYFPSRNLWGVRTSKMERHWVFKKSKLRQNWPKILKYYTIFGCNVSLYSIIYQ